VKIDFHFSQEATQKVLKRKDELAAMVGGLERLTDISEICRTSLSG